jgi:ADP-ribose pyrophosphatase YjhB (NUDIX family)
MDIVANFLKEKEPVLVSYVSWGKQDLDFDVASYFSDDYPPSKLVTSVRAIVIHQDRIVVMENESGKHFLPGGRLDEGEGYSEGLIREVKEECGLDVQELTYLGFLHFKHLQKEPEDYPYPYPHMFQLVYSAEGTGVLVQEDEDGYEFASHLYEKSDAMRLPNTEPGKPFLERVRGN